MHARRHPSTTLRLAIALALLVLLAALAPASGARAQEGWTVERFDAAMTIQPDGSVEVVETIAVDYGALEKHGIFRELVTKVPYEGDSPACEHECKRVYGIGVAGVERGGEPEPWETSSDGDMLSIRIGDPDVTISGQHTYELRYTIHGALNHVGDTDELFWNITGEWPVPMEQVTVTVGFPEAAADGGLDLRAACFQGGFGSTDECSATVEAQEAAYESTRTLGAGEQLTVVTGWPAGLVQVDPPMLEEQPSFWDYFTFDWLEWAGLAAVGVVAAGGLARLWWLFGRDREYTSMYYLTEDPERRTRPLFGQRDVVIEYTPPEDWRPAQMGVLLDEEADNLDVTATIIDLAVRGYLEVTEIPPEGVFSFARKPDWKLTKMKPAGGEMLDYERKLFGSLFAGRDEVLVSELKTTFHEDLKGVKDALYRDAVANHWFRWNPETTRMHWRAIGLGLIAVGVGLCFAAAIFLERGLLFAPVALAGLVLMFAAHVMPRRTARGSEALRRTLGFRRYVAEGEQQLHEFHEAEHIFARYLPYAIVFGTVDKWAKAFHDIGVDTDEAITWYHGTGPLRLAVLSSHLHSFSDSMSSAMAATPGGSGSSGFGGGGFAGGGGGGGGGGSW